jgi:hypothetical protein
VEINENIQTEPVAKTFYYSKTLWVNIIALVGILAMNGICDAEQWNVIAAGLLGAVNVVLRIVTNEPIVW